MCKKNKEKLDNGTIIETISCSHKDVSPIMKSLNESLSISLQDRYTDALAPLRSKKRAYFNEMARMCEEIMSIPIKYKTQTFIVSEYFDFSFNQSQRAFGVTKTYTNRDARKFKLYVDKGYGRGQIQLSRWIFSRITDDKKWIDTMMHEMAHGIQHLYYGRSDHGPIWKEIGRTIGMVDPQSTNYRPQDAVLKYSVVCPNHEECGNSTPYARKPSKYKKQACGACCKKYNRGVWDDRFRLTLIQNY